MSKQGESSRKSGNPVPVVRREGRPIVVVALPLKPRVRDHLAALLGDVDLNDIRDDVLDADVVIAPPVSPQAIGALKSAYPSARVVLIELDDREFDVHLQSPVKRLLDAGGDAYLLADSIEDMARQLQGRLRRPRVEATRQAARELGRASTEDAILGSVHALIERRSQSLAASLTPKTAMPPNKPPR